MPVTTCDRYHADGVCNGFSCSYRDYDRYSRRTTSVHIVHPSISYPARTTRCPRCLHCLDHCGCYPCGFDHAPVETVCGYCYNCPAHDGCRTCSECGDRVRSGRPFCIPCNTCGDCCVCGAFDAPDSYPHAGTPTFHTPDESQLVRNPSRRYAALEIEISSTSNGDAPHLMRTLDRWNAALVHDGSIAGGNFEQEINTAPAAGDLLLDQIIDIADALASDGASANKSCGVHCHVDCRDFTFYDMRRLILLYEQIEDALFSMVPQKRRTSQWCHPCGKRYGDAIRDGRMPTDDNAKKAIVGNLYDIPMEGDDTADNRRVKRAIRSAKNQKYNHVRYNALNLHSWIYRGTVECRIHHGTVGKPNLVNWARLWVAIVDYAYNHTEEEIVALGGPTGVQLPRGSIMRRIKQPMDILGIVAPHLAGWMMTRVDRFSDGRLTEGSDAEYAQAVDYIDSDDEDDDN